MFKSLAVAALLGYGSAQRQGGGSKHNIVDMSNRTEDEKRGLEMMKGFFIGSGTVDLPPKESAELEACATYLEHVTTYGDNAYTNFKNFKKKAGIQEGFYDVMTGLKFVSSSVHMVTTSKKHCPTLAVEWDRVSEMGDAWNHPVDFAFDNQDEILFNGENLVPYIDRALQHYENNDYMRFGEQIGIASEQIMMGKTLIEEFGYDPRSQDETKLYFQRWGAEFIAGYAYGMHVGDFDQQMLYDCMAKEPRAEGIFYKGTVDMTRAMANDDPQLGMKALDTFIAFTVDFAMEHRGKKWQDKICPELTQNQEHLAGIYAMLKEITNKDDTLRYDESADVTLFNGQDITKEIAAITEAFQAQDATKMGYLFGDTLYEHLRKNGNNMPNLIM